MVFHMSTVGDGLKADNATWKFDSEIVEKFGFLMRDKEVFGNKFLIKPRNGKTIKLLRKDLVDLPINTFVMFEYKATWSLKDDVRAVIVQLMYRLTVHH